MRICPMVIKLQPKYFESSAFLKINVFQHLLFKALITISTLPFHLVNDLWRWKVFREEVSQDEWNSLFWSLKEKYLGVEAPVERTKEDLDPPTLFHINGDYTMMR